MGRLGVPHTHPRSIRRIGYSALAVALLSVPIATTPASAEAPATTATVLAAKAYPGIQLIQTDYTASVSVPPR